jgi:hypothetical protein
VFILSFFQILHAKAVGDSTNKKVRNLMEGLMTPELASEFSWAGANCPANVGKSTKPPFNPIFMHIIGFVEAVLVDEVVDSKHVRMGLQDFFKRAPGRCSKSKAAV